MSSLPIPGGILGTVSPAYGMASGQGLGGLLPMMSPLALLLGAGGKREQAPGEAVGPVPIAEAPTLAANASAPQQPLMPQREPMAGRADMGLPGMGPINDALAANAALGAAKPKGILGTIGAGLKDPNIKAALMRAAGATMSPGGGIGKGILAGADYYDQRRREASADAKFEREFGLKERGVDQDDRRISNQDRQFDVAQDTQRYGIDTQADVTKRGQDIGERDSIRDNNTQRYGVDVGAATTRRGQDVSLVANREDNATVRDTNQQDNATALGVAGITAGARNRLEPKDAMTGLGSMLPGLLGTENAEGVAKALAGAPDLQAQLIDAYTNAWGDGSGNAMERAQQAIAGILGEGAGFSDGDNDWVPFNDGSYKINRGKPRAPQGGGQPAAPKPGDVVDGFTFKGGNPADKKNWTK